MYKLLETEVEKEQCRQDVIMSEIARLRNQMTRMEDVKRLNRIYESGEIKKPRNLGDVLVPVLDEVKNNEGILQGSHGNDILGQNQCVSPGKIDWSCSLCQIIAPNEKALQKHLCSKKHNLKKKKNKDALMVEETGDSCIVGLSPRTSTLSAVETLDSCIQRVPSTSKTLLPLNTSEAGSMEQYLPLLQNDMNSDNLKENQSMLDQKVDWRCTLCKVVCPNEQALNAHLVGKKHRLENARTEINSVAPTNSVHAPVMNGKKEKTCLKDWDLPAFLENFNESDSQKNRSTSTQNTEWRCAQCQIIAPNEHALADHLRGKKHKLKGAALQAAVAEKNSSNGPFEVAGKMRPSMDKGVKLTDTSSKKWDFLPLQQNQMSDELEKNQYLLHQKVEWTCALCKVAATSKRNLSQHLLGKKHKLKEATVKLEGPRKSYVVESSAVTAKMSALETVNPCKPGALKSTPDSLLFMENGDASLKGHNLYPLRENACSVDLAKTRSSLGQKVEWDCALYETVSSDKKANDHLQGKKHKSNEARAKSVEAVKPLDPSADKVKFASESLLHGKLEKHWFSLAEWNCAICEVACPNEQALNKHLQGRKHNRKKSASKSEGPGNNNVIKPSTVITSMSFEKTTGRSKEYGIKFTDESSVPIKPRPKSLKEQDLPSQKNLNSGGLNKNQPVLVQKEGSSAPNKEHPKRRKHRSKKVALTDKGTGHNGVVGPWKHSGEARSKGQTLTLLHENPKSNYLNKVQSESLIQCSEWSCSLCKIIATSEQDLERHRHGKKHKLKEDALIAKLVEKVYRILPSTVTATKCVQVAGTMDPEKSLQESSGRKTEDPPSLQENLNTNDLKPEQSSSAPKVEWGCALCQISTAFNAIALEEHLLGKKHKAKEAALLTEVDGKSDVLPFEDCLIHDSLNENQGEFAKAEWRCDFCEVITPTKRALNRHVKGKKHQLKEESLTRTDGIQENLVLGFSKEMATETVPVITTVHPNLDEGLKLLFKPSQLNGSKGHGVQQLSQDNPSSNSLKGSQPIYCQSMQENRDLGNEKIVEYGNRETWENSGQIPDELRHMDDADPMPVDWKKNIVTWFVQKGLAWLN